MTLRLNGSNSGFTEVKAPATAGSNTITLPTSNGSANQYLKNGSTAGTLEFANGGKILQVQSTIKTTAFSSSSTSFTDITGLSVSITPSSTSNKILIFCSFMASGDTWSSGTGVLFNLVRGSTNISQSTGASQTNATAGFNSWADGEGNTRGNFSSVAINFLDSPSTTSATTYKIQGRHTYTTGPYTFNVGRRNISDVLGFASVITAMEVEA